MLGGEYEDGEETKSDFLARMLLMDRIEIDPTGKYDFKFPTKLKFLQNSLILTSPLI